MLITPQSPRPRLSLPRHSAATLLAPLIGCLLALAGCTALPAREFTDYRTAFASARAAGEQVLLDYGVAHRDAQRVIAEARAARPRRVADDEPPAWSRAAVLAAEPQDDPVAVRMRAWAAVAGWNDALAALAEGKPAADLGVAFDGFAGALKSFPWASLGDKAAGIAARVGGPIGPAVEAVRELIVQAKREADRRRFLDAIDKGAPLVLGLVELMGQDSDDFWFARHLLIERERAGATMRLGDLIAAAQNAVSVGSGGGGGGQAGAGSEADLDVIVDRINAAVGRVRDFRVAPGTRVVLPAGAMTSGRAAGLRILAGQIERQADAVVALDQRLADYEATLTAYVRLLDSMRRAMEGLRDAAARAERAPEPPDVADLAGLALRVRQAFEAYRQR